MTEVTFNFRVPQTLKDEFVRVAKLHDQNASQLLRIFMKDFIRDNTPTEGYDEWLRSQVERSLADSGKGIPDDEVEAHFAARRGS
jgi:hypothetical protein